MSAGSAQRVDRIECHGAPGRDVAAAVGHNQDAMDTGECDGSSALTSYSSVRMTLVSAGGSHQAEADSQTDRHES